MGEWHKRSGHKARTLITVRKFTVHKHDRACCHIQGIYRANYYVCEQHFYLRTL